MQIGKDIRVLTTTQDYIGEFVYQNGALDYLIHEEGRVVSESNGLFYEYYLKDHLGNVRQVLRNSTANARIATMEQANAEEEESTFTQIKPTRKREPRHNVTQGGQEVAWLNASMGEMVGPGTTQEIFEGDSVTLSVHGKFLDKKKARVNEASFLTEGGKTALLDHLNELALNSQMAGGPNPIAVLNLVDIVAKDLQKKETPEAYLIYALYDQDSNRYEVGKKVMTRNAANQHEELEEKLAIRKNGYIETFVVNETSQDVWFDNFKILSQGSILVQETHYDPWGLELTGIGYEYAGVKKNKYLYNGKELIEDAGLQYYDYGARYYDPAIGRWTSPDPLAHLREWVSPYNFVQNNPLNRIDPDGRFDWVANKEGEVYWDENATSQATTKTGETYLGKSGTGVDEQTGNTVVYNSDGSTTEGIRSLPEFTVSSPNPVQDAVYRGRREFAAAALGVTKDATSSVATLTTSAGLMIAPFAPPAGAGLFIVGQLFSGISGLSSFTINASNGNIGAAATDGVLLVVGSGATNGISSMGPQGREVIDEASEVILQGVQGTSLEITSQFIVPAFQKKKDK